MSFGEWQEGVERSTGPHFIDDYKYSPYEYLNGDKTEPPNVSQQAVPIFKPLGVMEGLTGEAVLWPTFAIKREMVSPFAAAAVALYAFPMIAPASAGATILAAYGVASVLYLAQVQGYKPIAYLEGARQKFVCVKPKSADKLKTEQKVFIDRHARDLAYEN